MATKSKRNVLIIGEAPDENEATQTEATKPRRARKPTPIDEDSDEDTTQLIAPESPEDTEPAGTNPLLQARDVRIGPLRDFEEDETAPINRDALRRARDLPEATWPPEHKEYLANAKTRPRVRPLGAVEPLDFEPAPERAADEPVVFKGTVVPGATASFFLGDEGRPMPSTPRAPEARGWRLLIAAPAGAQVYIDGVDCGQGPVTIEGEAVGLSLVVEVRLGGRSWTARQPIEALVGYELHPTF